MSDLLNNRFLDDRRVLGNQLHGPIGRRSHNGIGVDAEQMIQCATKTLDLVEFVRDLSAGLIGGADDVAAAKAAPRREDELRIVPVIAPRVLVGAAFGMT